MGINTIFIIKLVVILCFIFGLSIWAYRSAETNKMMSWKDFVRAVEALNQGKITQKELQILIKKKGDK